MTTVKNTTFANLYWLQLSVSIILIDQFTKYTADTALPLLVPQAITSNFNLTLLYNYGAAFDILSDAGGWQRWFFITTALLITAVMTIWLNRLETDDRWTALSLALIIGGAVGNLIDRVIYGYVIDFLDFYIGDNHWPTFNVADSAITVGAIILLISGLLVPHKQDADTHD